MAIINRSERNLRHAKTNRIEIVKGIPRSNEGNNGELRLSVLAKGIFLYAKYGNKWYQLSDAAIASGGQFSAQGVASQGGGTLATSIDRGNQSLKMGGNVVLSGNTISNTGSNTGIKFDDNATARIDVATTKIGTNGYLALTDNEIDVSSGDLTLDVAGDITLNAGGNDITFEAGAVTLAAMTAGYFKIYNPVEIAEYFQIQIGTLGQTYFTTIDDTGVNQAPLVMQPQGDISLHPAANKSLNVVVAIKTESVAWDASVDVTETLNLSSGAGGSDVHYGIRYRQTQTDMAGWDSVYLMHLYGSAASGKIFSVDSGSNLSLDGNITVGGTVDGVDIAARDAVLTATTATADAASNFAIAMAVALG